MEIAQENYTLLLVIQNITSSHTLHERNRMADKLANFGLFFILFPLSLLIL